MMDDHSRTIIHIDIDCFYAQVEMNKEPSLRTRPMGVHQKDYVITSNYLARDCGIKKCMLISDAKKLCPNLVLIKGEDLYEYRQLSNKFSDLMKEYSPLVEKLGLDENFIDVSEMVNEKIQSGINDLSPKGIMFGDTSSLICECGCQERILIGTQIAQELRDTIFDKLQLTTCAGIAHNKILAKIVGSRNKPNKQTYLFPNSAPELMISLGQVNKIPSIGNVTAECLAEIGIFKTEDLQNATLGKLEKVFDTEKAKYLLNLSLGLDNTPVKLTGKPLTISLEDATLLICSKQVEDKFRELLTRLLILVKENGRIPKLLRITVRKLIPLGPRGSIRETRQCIINIPLNKEDRLINVAMSLFWKLIPKDSPFKINLLGLAFSKFVDNSNNSVLTSFLMLESNQVKVNDNSLIECQPVLKKSKLDDSLSKENLNCPPEVSKEVFAELPLDIQKELWDDYKNQMNRDKQRPTSSRGGKTNSILSYFVKQPKN